MKKYILFITLFSFPFTFLCEEEGGAHSGGWLTPIWGVPMIFWQAVNLILVFVLFYFLLRVKLPAFFRARKAEIEKALNKAKDERIAAEKKLQELEDKLSRLDSEVSVIIKDAERNAEKEKEILRKSAEESAQWVKKEAEEEFKRKQIEAERRIREFAVNEAVEIAKNLIAKHFEPQDRERVFSEFLKEIKERVNG